VLYHLQERAIEHAVLPWCAAHGVALVAYSPFGSGDFPAPQSPGGRVLAALARAHGATPRQVALAFLTRAPGTFAIPKAARAAHARENARPVALTPEDVRRLDAAFPRGEPRPLPIL
jgi:diketogulonate reductase-like aldo/keto reductase